MAWSWPPPPWRSRPRSGPPAAAFSGRSTGFNRRRYDAARTVQAFAVRLRQQVDLDALTAELLAVVDQTVQPTQVALWLRPPRVASRAANHAVDERRT